MSEEDLQIAEKRREVNGKIYPSEGRVPKNVNFLSDQSKEIEGNNRMGKTRDLFKKLEVLREHFMQRWLQ